MKKVIKYGVVGFSRNPFDKQSAYEILEKLFEQIATKHKGKVIEIVSGYLKKPQPATCNPQLTTHKQ